MITEVFLSMLAGGVLGRILLAGSPRQKSKLVLGWLGAFCGVTATFALIFVFASKKVSTLFDLELIKVGFISGIGLGSLIEGTMQLTRLRFPGGRIKSLIQGMLLLAIGGFCVYLIVKLYFPQYHGPVLPDWLKTNVKQL